MKRAGRVSPLVILGVLGLIGMLGIVVFTRGGTTPAQRVYEFFAALDRGDVDTLVKTSVFGDATPEEMRAKWAKTVERTENYIFIMQIKETNFATAEEATVAVEMFQNAGNPNVGSKRFQIPLVKTGGEWKVDAKSLTRSVYPALPR